MKRNIIVMILLLASSLVYGGNLAVLENLGFSADGRYFMFGQHVFEDSQGQVYAEAGIINVARNEFVIGGWKKSAYKVQRIPNQDTRGALYELLGEMTRIKSQYHIKHLELGHLLYTRSVNDVTVVKMNGSDPGLSFRDFETGWDYSLVLVQSSPDVASTSRSFHIQAVITDSNGMTNSYRIGNPSFLRPGVSSYYISRVWIGPNKKSLVIAVAKESPDLTVRYMVETAVIN